MNLNKEIIQAINTAVLNAIDKAPFDKTQIGIIKQINVDGTATIKINSGVTSNVPIYGDLTKAKVGDSVKVIVPQNNSQSMFIILPK